MGAGIIDPSVGGSYDKAKQDSLAGPKSYQPLSKKAHTKAASQASGNYKDLEGIERAFEQLSLTTPEDPPGFQSSMDPVTHQIRQVMAIGETVKDPRYPPAKVMLGNWRIYYPSDFEQVHPVTE